MSSIPTLLGQNGVFGAPKICVNFLFRFSKLARLRAQLLEPTPGAGSGGGSGFDVSKSGDARIALVGFPSVGKSTFLSKITKTKSEVAAYSFTTLTAIPGVLEYGGAEIQILDLPGIIEGASEGKGRGRQVISAAKVSQYHHLLPSSISWHSGAPPHNAHY